MDLKYLLTVIGNALLAAGRVFLEAVENAPENIAGTLLDTTSLVAGPAAPLSPGQAVIAAGPAVELDSDGLPWDQRIHASTKTKTQKGEWKKMRGVDDKTVAKVTKELRLKYPEPSEEDEAPQAPAAPSAPAAPVAPVAPKMPVAMTNYTKLCDWLAKNTGPGKVLTQEWVDSAFQGWGVKLPDLAARDTDCPAYLQAFRDSLAQTGTPEVQ